MDHRPRRADDGDERVSGRRLAMERRDPSGAGGPIRDGLRAFRHLCGASRILRANLGIHNCISAPAGHSASLRQVIRPRTTLFRPRGPRNGPWSGILCPILAPSPTIGRDERDGPGHRPDRASGEGS